jgi:hypothetical protein
MTTRNDHRMKSFAHAAISPAAPCIVFEKPGLYALGKKP